MIAQRDGTRVELEHRDLPEPETETHIGGWTHYLRGCKPPRQAMSLAPIPGCDRLLMSPHRSRSDPSR
jgi:hypothetical protein